MASVTMAAPARRSMADTLTADNDRAFVLGMDCGGTQSRWAAADLDGRVIVTGLVGGLGALMQSTPAGRDEMQRQIDDWARQVQILGQPSHVWLGVTGLGGPHEPAAAAIAEVVAQAFGVAQRAVTLASDIELAYRSVFEPGDGHLVYAGTGSVGAHLTLDGRLERAGGHGGVIDDGGSGYWIAREAMRLIWRAEDESPGAWRTSRLAAAVFEHVGGSDWPTSRRFIYERSRGEVGQLALAVAGVAHEDTDAAGLMARAGEELARLALALCQRIGPRPIALAGRVASLHPAIEAGMRARLGPGLPLERVNVPAAHAAARLAARHVTLRR